MKCCMRMTKGVHQIKWTESTNYVIGSVAEIFDVALGIVLLSGIMDVSSFYKLSNFWLKLYVCKIYKWNFRPQWITIICVLFWCRTIHNQHIFTVNCLIGLFNGATSIDWNYWCKIWWLISKFIFYLETLLLEA